MKAFQLTLLILFAFSACSSSDEKGERARISEEMAMPVNNQQEKTDSPTEQPPIMNSIEVVKISTRLGDIYVTLFEETPQHKANFLKLAREGFYDGTTFHRVIDNFMIQGGDPNSKDDDPANDGQGGPGYTIPAEIRPELKHSQGMLAAARQADQVNPNRESSGSQFYIVENPQGTPHLDGAYTVFGKVIKGIEVVELIAKQPTGPNNRPIQDIPMKMEVMKLSPKQFQDQFGAE